MITTPPKLLARMMGSGFGVRRSPPANPAEDESEDMNRQSSWDGVPLGHLPLRTVSVSVA